jgi:hypothetical protein
MSEEGTPKRHERVIGNSLGLRARVLQPTVWLTQTLAPDWLADALSEARKEGEAHSSRREILFGNTLAAK